MASTLISVEELGQTLGRDLSADAGATLAVEAASQVVKTVSEQDFQSGRTQTLTMDGTGTDSLVLPQRPITNIRSVSVNGTEITDYVLTSYGALVRKADTTTDPNVASGWIVWPQGRQNVVVDYDHGYSTSQIPADVKAVARAIAARLFIQANGELAQTIGDVSIRYAVAPTDLTAGEKLILRKYRQVSSP